MRSAYHRTPRLPKLRPSQRDDRYPAYYLESCTGAITTDALNSPYWLASSTIHFACRSPPAASQRAGQRHANQRRQESAGFHSCVPEKIKFV